MHLYEGSIAELGGIYFRVSIDYVIDRPQVTLVEETKQRRSLTLHNGSAAQIGGVHFQVSIDYVIDHYQVTLMIERTPLRFRSEAREAAKDLAQHFLGLNVSENLGELAEKTEGVVTIVMTTRKFGRMVRAMAVRELRSELRKQNSEDTRMDPQQWAEGQRIFNKAVRWLAPILERKKGSLAVAFRLPIEEKVSLEAALAQMDDLSKIVAFLPNEPETVHHVEVEGLTSVNINLKNYDHPLYSVHGVPIQNGAVVPALEEDGGQSALAGKPNFLRVVSAGDLSKLDEFHQKMLDKLVRTLLGALVSEKIAEKGMTLREFEQDLEAQKLLRAELLKEFYQRHWEKYSKSLDLSGGKILSVDFDLILQFLETDHETSAQLQKAA